MLKQISLCGVVIPYLQDMLRVKIIARIVKGIKNHNRYE